MPRGLSDLQKTILLLAYKKVEEPTGAGLYRWEILAAYYGWEVKQETKRVTTPTFQKAAVGREYMAAQVAVTRAIRRLCNRGLIQYGHRHPNVWGPPSVVLTEAGKAIAIRLASSIG